MASPLNDGVPELRRIGPFASEAEIARIETVPLEKRLGVHTAYEAIAASAARFPNKCAVSYLPEGLASDPVEEMTYAGLLAELTGTANLLRSLGINDGNVVAVLLPNVPEFFPIALGACTAGVVFPINYLLEAEQIAELVRASGARVLVTVAPSFDPEIWRRAQAVGEVIDNLKIIAVRGEAPNAVSYRAALADSTSESLTFQPDRSLDRVTALLHTGGSTGNPKIALQTSRNLLFEAWVLGAIREDASAARCICGGPLFHAAGLVITGLMPLYWGATIVMLSPWGYRGKGVIADLWNVVEKHQITHLTLVPTILTVLSGLPFKPIPSLRHVGSGAAPLPRPLHDKFLKLTGLAVGQGYGLTEAACAVTTTQHSVTPFGAVGRRLPYVQVRTVLLDEAGNEVRDAGDGEFGVLAVKGPNVFAGYLGRGEDKSTWLRDRWLNTGDIGYRDRDGFFWLVGRAKDIIVRGGHNIDPRIIEDALLRLNGVKDAAAVGMPDAYAGELPIAFVVLEAAAHSYTPEQILRDVAPSISERAAVPKRIVLVNALPKTRVDKVDKVQLRATAARLSILETLAATGIASSGYEIGEEAKGSTMQFVVRFPPTAAAELRERARAATESLGLRVTVE